MNGLHSRAVKLRPSCLALAAGAALTLAPGTFAQTPSEKATDIVVVTGSATPTEYEKIGSSLTVINGEVIEDQGYTYVPDVLRQVAGLAVNRAGPIGGVTQVRIRGAEANHTLVLLDGIDVSSPDEGATDFSTLLSGDLRRIEVLRGPQSGLYGSNALAGVVNLITQRDLDGHYVNVALEGGSFNTLQLQGSTGFGDGRDYLSGGFQALTTDGYDVSADTSAAGFGAIGVAGKAGDDEGNRMATVYVRGGKEITPAFRIDGIARYLNKDSDLDGQAFNFPIPSATYDDASDTSHRQFLIGGSGTLSLMDGTWDTVFSASHVDEKRRNSFTNFPYLTGPTLSPADLVDIASATVDPSGADATRTKLAIQSTYQFGGPDFVSYLTGFVENKEETYADPFTTRDEERNLVGIGAQYRAEIAEQIYLSVTARHDDNDAFKDADTYSIAASWVIPGPGTRPHASFGTGITNPTFFEQFGFVPSAFDGNPDLVPEEAEGWDIGVEQAFLDGRVIVDVTYFESILKNEIYTAYGPAPDYFSTPLNRATESDRSGWEVSFGIFPTDDIDVTGSYTNLDATEPAGIEIRRPEDQGALDVSWRIGGGPLQLNLGVTYNGEQVDTDFASFMNLKLEPYTLVRLGASWRINDNIELYGRIENATDEDYEEAIGYRVAPSGVFFGMRFTDGVSK